MTSENVKSWTDDLPPCSLCGFGYSTSQIYKEDGSIHGHNSFLDRSFRCKVDENTSIYALFSGHHGAKVSEFALQRVAAEILLGQLNAKISDEEVKDVLKQAFISVEKAYMDSVDSLIATKTMLQYEIPDGISQYEISQKYQPILDKLNSINLELQQSASAAIVLIHYSKLYICNIGNCRVLLCKNDNNNVLRVVQLSVDHNIDNEDEVLRLSQLGLDIQSLKSFSTPTRCIGNYLGKSGYKDCDYLYNASSEPILAQPEIIGGIPIDSTCRFLLILSGGVCKSLEDIFSTEAAQINKDIIQMTVEQFRIQSTLMGVAQSIIHKLVQLHHDNYMQQIQENNSSEVNSIQKIRHDMALLVRNFNFPLPNAINTQKRNSQVRFNPVLKENFIRYTESEMNSIFGTNDTSYSIDSSCSDSEQEQQYDKNVKITPYVDFSDYFHRIDVVRKNNGILPPEIDY